MAAGLLTGIAVSFGFATLPAFIVAGVPAHQSGIANGINSIARSLDSSLGSAVITAVLGVRLLTGRRTVRRRSARPPAHPSGTAFRPAFSYSGEHAYAPHPELVPRR
ncbi:hypothetical protein [Streptomyces candidus]|uniref:MFS transporter n=1 Tax=Streptomyces candidus TaxID=67283 RepID=A0A7X0HEC0_9ACTN|nr:hypothetical protein [Streptomyces candidus]MBB6436071.1 hypothetical protein [Streptomyces candidus]GHH43529.1 hypothetical protein GCM10018773_29760 [Streptomyces candidus]